MFLTWQIFVCASIVGAGMVSKNALRVVAFCWLAWTLVAVLPVYAPWVGVFQLANLAISYTVMSSQH